MPMRRYLPSVISSLQRRSASARASRRAVRLRKPAVASSSLVRRSSSAIETYARRISDGTLATSTRMAQRMAPLKPQCSQPKSVSNTWRPVHQPLAVPSSERPRGLTMCLERSARAPSPASSGRLPETPNRE